MGRPRKSSALKIHAGNPGKRPIPIEATASLADANTPPPKHLNKEAADIWRSLLPQLVGNRTHAPPDTDMLAVYCEAVATIRAETIAIEDEGTTFVGAHGPVTNPRVKVRADATHRMLRTAGPLGIGQANRQKLSPIAEVVGGNKKARFFAG